MRSLPYKGRTRINLKAYKTEEPLKSDKRIISRAKFSKFVGFLIEVSTRP